VKEKSPHDEVLLKLKIMYGSVSSIYAVSSEVADLSASQHLVLHFHFNAPGGGGINRRTVVRRNINHTDLRQKKFSLRPAKKLAAIITGSPRRDN